MKKAVLSNRIFLNYDKNLYEKVKKNLTYKIPAKFYGDPPLEIKNYGLIDNKFITLPIGRQDLIPIDYEIVDKRILNPVEFPEFNFELRPSQKTIYDRVNGNCLINANVAWGKTFTALAIAKKLGQKTLVIVHTVNLREQWEKEAEKTMGIKPGIIGSGKLEYKDQPIVIANIQTLRRYINQVKNDFGTVILDECLDYESRIETKEGIKKIGNIVNNKLPVSVLSYNENCNKFEYKRVLNYFKNKVTEPLIYIKCNNNTSLKCTKNHTIYTYDGEIIPLQAEYLELGDYIVTKPSHKSSNLLNYKYEPLLLGLILGDGSISTNNTSCRIKICHGEEQLSYLKYKREILNSICGTNNIVKSKSGYKAENNIYAFNTLSFIDIKNWRQELYEDNSKKRVSKRIANILDEISWSFIYQDDGSIDNNKYICFSFCELDKHSINLLINSLKNLFSINDAYIYTCNKGYNYLRIKREGSEKFISKIEHLIHPDLNYKKGIYNTNKNFSPIILKDELKEPFSITKINYIGESPATNGYRYNIEVEDNHNYIANNKLVANCHHAPAKVFDYAINGVKARYKIGLSATLKRKDNMHIVIPDFFSRKIYIPPKENQMKPKVHMIKTGIMFSSNNMIPWALRINELVDRKQYKELISSLANRYADLGHKVLVVSDRTEFLDSCTNLSGDRAACIIGSTENRDELHKEIEKDERDILYGSINIYKEGISLNYLSCLILATPINNDPMLEQLIGRILREYPNKLQPIIVDIILQGTTAKNQAKIRAGYYIRQGYEVTHIDLS